MRLDIVDVQTPVVRAEALSIRDGERVMLAGASGSGKSVFLRALADLLPWQGDIRLDQESVHAMPAHQWRGQVMYLEADSAWWADQVRDHFPADANPPLADADLDPALLDASPERISSGQRQRLALLRALVRRPKVLLLDEPTANLDPDNAARLEKMLLDWSADGGILLMTSHDLAQRERLGTRHWLVADGRVREGRA